MVGASMARIDARAKVTGQALYPGDLVMPGMLHSKVLFARRPHARVLHMDLRAAEAVPGVRAIFTGRDVPNNEFGLVLFDQPVMVSAHEELRTSGSVTPFYPHKRFDGVLRHIGEKLALIVADSEAIADHARSLIKVDFEDLTVIDNVHAAIASPTPIHPHYPDNVIQRYRVRHGDAAQAMANADVVIEDTYFMGAQEHAYLQPEAGLAYFDAQDRITIQVAGQWTHEDQEQVAHALQLPVDQIRVIYPAIGGAFGGREDMSVQIVLALAAQRLRRPVKIIWTREESIIGHHKRHPFWFHAKLGAQRDGTLVAAEITAMSDAGPYNLTSNKVLGNAVATCTGPYVIPNVSIDAMAVVTNNVPSGAFRGFGAPQGLFVGETQINKLAHVLGIDPIALRKQNGWRDGSITAFNSPVPDGCSLAIVLDAVVSHAQPAGTPSNGRKAIGIGVACGHKNIGFSFGFPERCEATIELHGRDSIERAVVFHGGADCGQGAHTAFLQVAADALNLPPEKISLVLSDTASSGSSGSASASRLTFMAAHSILGAARDVLKKWHEDEERPARAHHVYRPRKTTLLNPTTGEGDPNITFAYVAQSAEVEVDLDTGHIQVRRLLCADDVGKAVNPQQVIGQIEGGAIQGLGYAVLENFVSVGGHVKSNTFSTYLIPSVLDIPDRLDSVIVEQPDPQGPLGIRGMAELPLMIVAPAITAAIHAATGVWINELPLTPQRVRAALAGR